MVTKPEPAAGALHGEAAALRQRFVEVRFVHEKRQQLAELMRLGHWKDAAAIAEQLGEPMPRSQVVRANFARART